MSVLSPSFIFRGLQPFGDVLELLNAEKGEKPLAEDELVGEVHRLGPEVVNSFAAGERILPALHDIHDLSLNF